jgi:uncharacterized membrane protein
MTLVLIVAATLAAPLTAGILPALSHALYAAFAWVCHQRLQRAWLLGAHPLPVCVRCLGIYLGALAGAVAGLRFSRNLLYASTALMAVEWLAEATILPGAPAGLRFSTGLLAGLFIIAVLWGEQRPVAFRIDNMSKEAPS